MRRKTIEGLRQTALQMTGREIQRLDELARLRYPGRTHTRSLVMRALINEEHARVINQTQ